MVVSGKRPTYMDGQGNACSHLSARWESYVHRRDTMRRTLGPDPRCLAGSVRPTTITAGERQTHGRTPAVVYRPLKAQPHNQTGRHTSGGVHGRNRSTVSQRKFREAREQKSFETVPFDIAGSWLVRERLVLPVVTSFTSGGILRHYVAPTSFMRSQRCDSVTFRYEWYICICGTQHKRIVKYLPTISVPLKASSHNISMDRWTHNGRHVLAPSSKTLIRVIDTKKSLIYAADLFSSWSRLLSGCLYRNLKKKKETPSKLCKCGPT